MEEHRTRKPARQGAAAELDAVERFHDEIYHERIVGAVHQSAERIQRIIRRLARPPAPSEKPGQRTLSEEKSFATSPLVLEGVPFNAGIIVAKHGQTDRLGYADRGVWTGASLPEPKTCPSIADVPTCGGYCGGCPVGQVCTGRSPLHPYGICIPQDAGVCSRVTGINGSTCSASEGCFIFKVEAEHQMVADATGFCVPYQECQALAASLPGGGFCK